MLASLVCVLVALAAPGRCIAAECGLVVVEAGAPRTGSTQQAKLILTALEALGLGDKVSDAGYWDWANHEKLEGAALAEHEAQLKARLQLAFLRSTKLSIRALRLRAG